MSIKQNIKSGLLALIGLQNHPKREIAEVKRNSQINTLLKGGIKNAIIYIYMYIFKGLEVILELEINSDNSQCA